MYGVGINLHYIDFNPAGSDLGKRLAYCFYLLNRKSHNLNPPILIFTIEMYYVYAECGFEMNTIWWVWLSCFTEI